MIETLQFQAIAAAGIALLVGLSWLLGFRGRARIDSLEAIAAQHGVHLKEVALDEKGRAGVGLTQDGKVLVAKTMGLDVAVRLLVREDVAAVRVWNNRVQLRFVDLGYPAVDLAMTRPPLWLGRIA